MKLIIELLEQVFVWFFFQISRFTEIVLERDSEKEYRFYYDEEDPACPTLLHLAVGWNFYMLQSCLLKGIHPLYTQKHSKWKRRESIYQLKKC